MNSLASAVLLFSIVFSSVLAQSVSTGATCLPPGKAQDGTASCDGFCPCQPHGNTTFNGHACPLSATTGVSATVPVSGVVCNNLVIGPVCFWDTDNCVCNWRAPPPCSTAPPPSPTGTCASSSTSQSAGQACPAAECGNGATPLVSAGGCCPQCVNPTTTPVTCGVCSSGNVVCPQNTAAGVDVCGCTSCVPVCSGGCTEDIACVNGQTAVTIPGNCCPVCRGPVNCSLVACPDIAFCNTTIDKLVIPDGQCCPRCIPRTDLCAHPLASANNLIACNTVACANSLMSTYVDGYCCPLCRPPNYCDEVLCSLPNCRAAATSFRNGSCCHTCSNCIVALENNTATNPAPIHYRCDRQDNFVCHCAYSQDATTGLCTVRKTTVVHARISITITNTAMFQDNFDIEYRITTGVAFRRECFNTTLVPGAKRSSDPQVNLDLYCDTSQETDCNAQLQSVINYLSGVAGIQSSTTVPITTVPMSTGTPPSGPTSSQMAPTPSQPTMSPMPTMTMSTTSTTTTTSTTSSTTGTQQPHSGAAYLAASFVLMCVLMMMLLL